MYENQFCHDFKTWRKRNKVPMLQVSKALSTPVSTLNSWINGYIPLPTQMKKALERKSLDDLISCLTTDRDRFERELERARKLDYFSIIVEASMEDVAKGCYRSKLTPHSAFQSIMAFQVRYGVNFIWAGNRERGEYATFWTLGSTSGSTMPELQKHRRALT
ncbi:MAG: ERCC4 domain-containing protein [Desulfovibrio sp.]|nr:ERCC4 domain-containing protein [Desulfovibrio sp.]MBI4960779.1 ERCC4 domain-containing protein [Desulfovibrio sp.]